MPNKQISHQRLLQAISYDPATGAVSRRGSTRTGLGEKKPTGHIRVVIDGVRYSLGRLCWFYVHGKWPMHFVDHINGNPADNRITNLRDVKPAINNQNRRTGNRNSKTQRMGVVRKESGRFSVSMSFLSHPLTVSGFKSEEAAASAYVELKRRLHDGFVEVQQ